MPKVAVIGANGQVGSELCLYLKVMGFCEPIAVTRFTNSAAILTRSGVQCRAGDVSKRDSAADLLGDCELVIDLSLVKGSNLAETRALIRARAQSIFAALRPEQRYVYASTVSVYRAGADQPYFRWYRAMKLYSERLATSLGASHRIPVHVLRLGQVHGEIQSCSEALRRDLEHASGPMHVPDQKSSAVFVFSIAEAVRLVLAGAVTPGTYTLVANPSCTFAELIGLYAAKLGRQIPVVLEPAAVGSPMRHSINAVKSWLGGGVARWVDYEKELLSAIVSYVSEERERKLRFQNTCKRARRAIGAYFDNTRHRPFAPIDPVPGQRIAFDRDWREAMAGPERQVQALLRNLI